MNGVSSPPLDRTGDTMNDQLPTPAPSPVVSFLDTDEELQAPRKKTISTRSEIEHKMGTSTQGEIHMEPTRNNTGGSTVQFVESNEEESGGARWRRTSQSNSQEQDKFLKLSPAKIQELTSVPDSLPLGPIPRFPNLLEHTDGLKLDLEGTKINAQTSETLDKMGTGRVQENKPTEGTEGDARRPLGLKSGQDNRPAKVSTLNPASIRPSMVSRAVSTPPVIRRRQSAPRTPGVAQDGGNQQKPGRIQPLPVTSEEPTNANSASSSKFASDTGAPSQPTSLPLPPLSISTFLQLELSSDKPSPLYIYQPANAEFPYESSMIKFERLLNILLLPPQLERTLAFGALACMDAWLYIFTILPLRFFKALWILAKWWTRNAIIEARDLAQFVYLGLGRLWRRRKTKPDLSAETTPSGEGSRSRRPSVTSPSTPLPLSPLRESPALAQTLSEQVRPKKLSYRHRRTKSTPSTLLPNHKADILKGLLVVFTCLILMRIDASKLYHGIRGQADMKLYVLYNLLEVLDRLLGALGQDVLECLFSREMLERNLDGRSKIMRPFWMFLLALAYNVIHAMALFYQVITLNVAVNSYSNALLTLLMSNQFVEIKGTVFKKFEKENLFQLTCADVVERFQLWLMLLIIGMRNIVEVGLPPRLDDPEGGAASNMHRGSIVLPNAFTILPEWTGQVFGPFVLVLGSEMIVDWIKHAYITKFNNTKPAVYGRYLDILTKDYYSHAFADQDLTKRLGLPVLPLSCLFIRSVVQIYHMFIATHMPPPLPSAATSLSTEATETTPPATTAVLAHIDRIFRRALGRAAFGDEAAANASWNIKWWSHDDFIAVTTMVVIFIGVYLFLLGLKLLLGMSLLSFSRRRYRGMKEREKAPTNTEGKRVGGWGSVELQDEKKRWIYADDPDGLKALKEREAKQKDKEEKALNGVIRYSMVAKRIW